jgi:hypothetical protein
MSTGDPEAIFLLDWQTGAAMGHYATGGYWITGLTFDPTSTFIAGIACHDASGHLIMWKRDESATSQGGLISPVRQLAVFATMEHAKLEEVKLRSSIHASFDEFEQIDMALRGTVAPEENQPGEDCVFVALDAGEK